MWGILSAYWPHIFAVVSLAMATAATVHAVMTKDEVRAAIGWTAVIVLSPVIGAVLYAIAGINRIRRAAILSQRPGHRTGDDSAFHIGQDEVAALFGQRFSAMKTLGDRVARHPLTRGNTIHTLRTGDEAYAAMLEAIGEAERSILLETYIFDRDPIGLRIADALIAAKARGVVVKVLIDAVGARYSVPSIAGRLAQGGIDVRVFNGNIIVGLRLPYANLRTHRKIIVVDGTVSFMGGMNIRQGFTSEFSGDGAAHDTHFRVTGPVVADLFAIASEDWRFTTNEALEDEVWDIPPPPEADSPVLMRAVPSGPDSCLENNHKLLIGALSIARRSVKVMSPYFLPDQELISALVTAARRGVSIDIVVPAVNNLVLVDRAMTAQFDQMLKNYCRIWRSTGPFDHSKLLAIDGSWAYVGSSNLDPRSLRLNFEIDVEVLDHGFAGGIEARIDTAIETAQPVTLDALRARSFPIRLIDRLIWLGSPYL